jgi:hypothetical protein
MIAFLLDPKLFNYVILAMYAVNGGRWALEGSWGNAMYWSGAFWITAAVTWGLNK